MMTVSTSEESERRLGEAMRAHASGAGRPGFVGRNPGPLAEHPAAPTGPRAGQAAPSHAAAVRPGAAAAGREHRPQLMVALASTRLTLLLALLGGVVLGIALALLSLLVPGALPPLG
jgi:hypothetical protein